jgi:signal peptidase I
MSEPVIEIAPPARAFTAPHPSVGVLPALQSLLYVLIVSLGLITFTVQPIRIPSGSMQPTLLVGDFLLLDRQAVTQDPFFMPRSTIGRGDVIVFHDPVDDPSVHLVKRVIGVPGDRIHLRDGVVYRNGEALVEPYAVHRRAPGVGFRDDFPDLSQMDYGVNAAWWVHLRTLARTGEVTVPPESYFVMGDNRNDSEDSRYWGFVPRKAIVGKPVMVYFSLRQGDDDDDGNRTAAPRVSASGWPPRWDRVPAGKSFARWDRMFRVIR